MHHATVIESKLLHVVVFIWVNHHNHSILRLTNLCHSILTSNSIESINYNEIALRIRGSVFSTPRDHPPRCASIMGGSFRSGFSCNFSRVSESLTDPLLECINSSSHFDWKASLNS